MSWKTKSIEQHHCDAMHGFDVVGVLETVIPLFELTVDVTYVERTPWDLAEEFVARAIAEVGGFTSASEVADFLGLRNPAFVTPTIEDLEASRLVNRNSSGVLEPTMALSEAIREKCLPKRTTRQFNIVENRFLSRFMVGPLRVLRSYDDEWAARLPSDLDKSALVKWLTGSSGPLRDAEVVNLEIRDCCCNRGWPCQAIVFVDDADKDWGWAAYDPQTLDLAISLESLLRDLGVQEAAESLMLSMEPEPADLATRILEPEDRVVPQYEALVDSSQPIEVLDRAQEKAGQSKDRSFERLETAPARARLLEVIKGAKTEVLLFFPWIKTGGITEAIESALHTAINNNAVVAIAYGIEQFEFNEESHPKAISRLRAIRNKDSGAKVAVVWTGGSHTKEVAVDRCHYFSGSFNIFSYRGEPDRETGHVTLQVFNHAVDPPAAESFVRSLSPQFRRQLVKLIRSLDPPSTMQDWIASWKPVLNFGVDPESLELALSQVTDAERDRRQVAKMVIEGIERGPVLVELEHCVEIVCRWLADSLLYAACSSKEERALTELVKRAKTAAKYEGGRETARLEELLRS